MQTDDDLDLDLDLDGARVTAFHDALLAQPPAEPGDSRALWPSIERNHRCNAALWAEEDQARRTDVPDSEIVRCKRSIDRHNQRRNDAVEAIDDALMRAYGAAHAAPGARLHSETPGAMIDRLSILSLKIHHMRREAARASAGAAHVQACSAKLERLRTQRDDLRDCLDALLDELSRGSARFKLYRQYKMYNDPTLNPWLYQAQGAAPSASRSGPRAAGGLERELVFLYQETQSAGNQSNFFRLDSPEREDG